MSAESSQIERRLLDLSSHSIPSLSSASSSDAFDRLAEAIREDFGAIERLLEELLLLAEEKPRESDRQTALQTLASYRKQLDAQRQAYRQAALSTKRRLDSQKAASHRSDLLGASTKANATVAKQSASGDDALMTATSDVTDGLRRTMQLMQQELDRSLLTNQMLESSTDTLRRATNQQTTFTDILATSKTLITALERADVLDRLLLMAAIVLFGLVCLFIIKRRVLDKGLRLAAVFIPKRKRKAAVTAIASAASSILTSAPAASSLITSLSVASSFVQATTTSTAAAEPLPTNDEPSTSETLIATTTVPMSETPTTIPVAATPQEPDVDEPEPTPTASKDKVEVRDSDEVLDYAAEAHLAEPELIETPLTDEIVGEASDEVLDDADDEFEDVVIHGDPELVNLKPPLGDAVHERDEL